MKEMHPQKVKSLYEKMYMKRRKKKTTMKNERNVQQVHQIQRKYIDEEDNFKTIRTENPFCESKLKRSS